MFAVFAERARDLPTEKICKAASEEAYSFAVARARRRSNELRARV